MSLFGPGEDRESKPASDAAATRRMLVTVKAAPNPSTHHGETVCVAGISVDLDRPGWLRLYPINFRELGPEETFRKYDIIEFTAVPARQDQRRESWRPRVGSFHRLAHLPPWRERQSWLDPYLEDSMCAVNRAAQARPDAPSLALIRPREVLGLKIGPHPGWSEEEKAKIAGYIEQLDLLDQGHDRRPLEAPRMRAAYRYRCHEPACRGHQQGLLDWEFVALQRRLNHLSDPELEVELTDRFLRMMCSPSKSVAFFVGNQAKRAHVFSVLGVYYPPR